MLLVRSISGEFKRRQFEPEVILLAVGWYLRFSLSYRDVDSSGATLDFLRSAAQDGEAARRFLAKALGRQDIRRRSSSDLQKGVPRIYLPWKQENYPGGLSCRSSSNGVLL